jgi:hypothetical protein
MITTRRKLIALPASTVRGGVAGKRAWAASRQAADYRALGRD